MKKLITLLFISVAAPVAVASQLCAFDVAQLLADKKIPGVAAKFVGNRATAEDGIRSLVEKIGSLTNIQQATKPAFERHTRISAVASGLPEKYDHLGYWVDATSSKLGPVQLFIATKAGQRCQLYAVHVDAPLNK